MAEAYAQLPSEMVKAPNGVHYAYRDTGGDGKTPLVLFQHFRGNLDGWDPALIDALASGRRVVTFQPHSPANPAWLRPAPPDLALQGVLAGHQNRIARDQELLVDGQRRLADAQARFGPAMNGRFPEHLVSVVSDREHISELSASLMNTARKDWMTLENLNTEMPLTEDFSQPPLPAKSPSAVPSANVAKTVAQ
jgi:hypothetical protein